MNSECSFVQQPATLVAATKLSPLQTTVSTNDPSKSQAEAYQLEDLFTLLGRQRVQLLWR